MILTHKALELINNPRIRVLLALALGCTEQTVMRYIGKNSDNLTKAAPLEVIRQETGLPDNEILARETISSSIRVAQSY